MRRGLLVLGVLAAFWLVATSAGAVEISGTVDVGADLLPTLGIDADVGIVVAGESWSVSSTTGFGLLPAFTADEAIALSYTLDRIRLAANASFAIAPDPSSAQAGASATIDLFDAAIREADPAVALSADGTIGATIDETVDPYARLLTQLSFGNHWVSNTTSLSFSPLDVASSVLAYFSLGSFALDEDVVTVTFSCSIAAGLVPLAFSYAKLDALASIGQVSILTSVTYMGETTFIASSQATVTLDPVTLAIWGSYTSVGDDPFAVGITAGTSWGPL